jgi:hypothetical protein
MTAHVFGAAFAKKAQVSYLSWIADGMRLDDFPGSLSMFEREVSFASSILRKTSGGNGIVLYDELFHSTNPPDAIRTSELFCKNLWQKTNCISVISTHVYSLARNAPQHVKALCVAATHNNGELEFTKEEVIIEPGTLFWFDNKKNHMAENIGDVPRIAFIFDVPIET